MSSDLFADEGDDLHDEPLTYYSVLVTGANSGLGLDICKRLIDEFLHTRSKTQALYLVPTTRSLAKANETLQILKNHVGKAVALHTKLRGLEGAAATRLHQEFQQRIALQPQLMDLCDLKSIRTAARALKHDLPNGRLDVLIANAGIGGWTGINWARLFKQLLTQPHMIVSKPTFKNTNVGMMVKAKGSPPVEQPTDMKGGKETAEKQQLGEVFTANVFGHYMFIHWLASCFKTVASPEVRSRIIWVSSLEAYAHTLNIDVKEGDIQGIKRIEAYECSKRLTDILALTSEDAGTQTSVNALYDTPSTDKQPSLNPRMYITHPGICATSIMPMPFFMVIGQYIMFYITRALGSPWHVISSYIGATSMVWLALANQATLDKQEKEEGKAKWGSATERFGGERALRTQVEGWGFGGKVGESGPKQGLVLGNYKVQEKDLQLFKKEGVEVWKQMEELRLYWEKMLD